jgi:uncharacterized membrane protein YqjE
VSHLADPRPGRNANSLAGSGASSGDGPSTGDLVSRLSTELSQLLRDEMRLAQLEVTGKAKKAGMGVGMFGAAGLLAMYGVGVLIATAILALALAVDAWLAALIVAVVLLAAAGAAALVGKNKVVEAAPPVPTRPVENVKADVETVRHPGNH